MISVVIPALDEERAIAGAIGSVRDEAGEVIVADGGSADGTCAVAEAAGAVVVAGPRGRGAQLDQGARAARGEWLLFLHADTRLQPRWSAALRALEPDVAGGAFRLAIDSPRPAFRVIELGARLRCRFLRLPYGDQALFARREAYQHIGGFRPLPLMEDVDFVRRLRGAGRLALLPQPALTSPRRWEARGVLRGTLRNWRVMALYALGRSPESLARIYRAR
ncbi:MAG TPA: TIGR04283 family arsenosugar biosynthesis glycosyltransferase [Vicinamibacteria bacterium]|nr:TIGR04283 family arsenosugar biosynthesis glycosyltransferase [Vicinamibacteria bacterium]